MANDKSRREYGSGSVYKRADGKWVGAADAGYTSTGKRRRLTVTGRTEAEAKRKLRDKIAEIKAGEVVMSPTTTVKAWCNVWLPIKQRTLSPNGYKALASPTTHWIIPTIGHRRLSSLTPADVRAVEKAQRDVGRKGTTCAATQRALFNMLRAATAEGHAVPPRVLLAPKPTTSKSDRQPLSLEQSLQMLAVAADLPHGSRWAVALLMGMRQGECLGLTWDSIDWEGEAIRVEWQLQRIPYLDKKNRHGGFRLPQDYEARHVYKSWHLVRPKSKAGVRVYPLMPGIASLLRHWQENSPANAAQLVWPAADGKPRSNKDDLDEWHALQEAAGVRHPAGRYFHVHECRNHAATELKRRGADDNSMTSLMGHTSIKTTDIYTAVDLAAKRVPLALLAKDLGLA